MGCTCIGLELVVDDLDRVLVVIPVTYVEDLVVIGLLGLCLRVLAFLGRGILVV